MLQGVGAGQTVLGLALEHGGVTNVLAGLGRDFHITEIGSFHGSDELMGLVENAPDFNGKGAGDVGRSGGTVDGREGQETVGIGVSRQGHANIRVGEACREEVHESYSRDALKAED